MVRLFRVLIHVFLRESQGLSNGTKVVSQLANHFPVSTFLVDDHGPIVQRSTFHIAAASNSQFSLFRLLSSEPLEVTLLLGQTPRFFPLLLVGGVRGPKLDEELLPLGVECRALAPERHGRCFAFFQLPRELLLLRPVLRYELRQTVTLLVQQTLALPQDIHLRLDGKNKRRDTTSLLMNEEARR